MVFGMQLSETIIMFKCNKKNYSIKIIQSSVSFHYFCAAHCLDIYASSLLITLSMHVQEGYSSHPVCPFVYLLHYCHVAAYSGLLYA